MLAAVQNFEAYIDDVDMDMLRSNFIQADATALERLTISQRENYGETIWFQCPWASPCRQGYTVDQLLISFFRSAASVQEAGSFVLLGLVGPQGNRKFYQYRFRELQKQQNRYEYVGSDTWLIKECLAFGYEHWSECTSPPNYCHDQYKDWFEIHVFRRRLAIFPWQHVSKS